jgi:hypothetical protein
VSPAVAYTFHRPECSKLFCGLSTPPPEHSSIALFWPCLARVRGIKAGTKSHTQHRSDNDDLRSIVQQLGREDSVRAHGQRVQEQWSSLPVSSTRVDEALSRVSSVDSISSLPKDDEKGSVEYTSHVAVHRYLERYEAISAADRAKLRTSECLYQMHPEWSGLDPAGILHFLVQSAQANHEVQHSIEYFATQVGPSFARTHRWQRPGIDALLLSVRKLLLPIPTQNCEVERIHSEVEEVFSQRCIASFGDSSIVHPSYARQYSGLHRHAGSFLTSAGYKDKAAYCSSDECIEVTDKAYVSTLLSGEYKPVCDVNEKAEIVEYGALGRTTYCVDPVTIILQVSLFHNQHARFVKSPLGALGSYVGKTPYGLGSLERWVHITQGGKIFKVFNLDVKKMEASIRTADLLRLARIRFRCLQRNDRTVANWFRIKHLYLGLAENVFLVPAADATLWAYWKGSGGRGGEPSGHFLTLDDNTLHALYLFYLAYALESHSRGERPNWPLFFQEFAIVAMGDDVQFSVGPKLELWLNLSGKSPAECLADHIFTATRTILESTGWDGEHVDSSKFCGMYFTYLVTPVYHISFKLDYDRQWNSIVQGGSYGDIYKTVQRIAGIRNVTWADPKLREEIASIYELYVQGKERTNPGLLADPAWIQAKQSYVPDSELVKLYFGLLVPMSG